MAKSLAELRGSSRPSLPERSYRLCLAAGLVARIQALQGELENLAVAAATVSDDGESIKKPGRMGAKPAGAARMVEIRAELAALWDELDEHTGELRVRALSNGEWRRWVDGHPARPDSQRDKEIVLAICNVDDLIDDLGLFAAAWNDEPLAPGDWDFIASKAPLADLKELAAIVVGMHEFVADLPKLRMLSSGNLPSVSD